MTGDSRIRLGLVGAGYMGRNHARVATRLPNVELKGVYDPNRSAAEKTAEQNGTAAFPNIEELCRETDAVIVASPTTFHFAAASKCLSLGKHVLVEKPIASTVEEAAALCELAEREGRVLLTGHIERFNPVYVETAKILKHEQPLALKAERLSPRTGQGMDVSVVLDLMIHDLDLVLGIAAEMPDTPSVMNVLAVGRKCDAVLPNFAHATISFDNDFVASLTASKITQEKIRILHVHCKEAFVMADFVRGEVSISRNVVSNYTIEQRGKVDYTQTGLIERVHVSREEPLVGEIAHFVDCVRTGRKPRVSGRDGLEALRIAKRIEGQIGCGGSS